MSESVRPSTVPVKPPRWNFAGVCVCCGVPGCDDPRCEAWHADSAWIVCPMCHGVQELAHGLESCWLCLFGVVEAEMA